VTVIFGKNGSETQLNCSFQEFIYSSRLTWGDKVGKSNSSRSMAVSAGSSYLLLQDEKYTSPNSQIPTRPLNIKLLPNKKSLN